MNSQSAPYGGTPPYNPAYWNRPPYPHPGGSVLRFVVGILLVLLLLAAIRAVVSNTGGEAVPWLEVAGALGIALTVLIGFAIVALVIAVVFGFVLPAVAGKGGDWMNPARWANFEAIKDLKVRYARGELPREDYLRVLKDIELGPAAAEAPPPPPPT